MSNDIDFQKVADEVLVGRDLIYASEEFFEYRNGVYQEVHELELKKVIKNIVADEYTTHVANQVLDILKTDWYVKVDDLNGEDLINLKNGLFDIKTFQLLPHDPLIYSTIQLDVEYNLSAQCPQWLKVLDEIFEGNQNKISIIQEFFGLCFSRETKYQKALFCIGEGANGKTTILNVLQSIIGADNRTSISLNQLKNNFYVSNLLGKLVNIASETQVKSYIYDDIFKKLVSGDSIQADAKFKKPFHFYPFCKLIFAVNNLPRVEDKSHAFFRRLIILRFGRIFRPHEQEKQLVSRLLTEKDGIFMWAVEGFKRLEQQGDFTYDPSLDEEINQYRMENNNVLLFVNDECVIGGAYTITKQELYKSYEKWCKDNGYRPSGNGKFSKELKRVHEPLSDGRNAKERFWIGIDLSVNHPAPQKQLNSSSIQFSAFHKHFKSKNDTYDKNDKIIVLN